MQTQKELQIADDLVLSKIYVIRNLKVMLDRDLAALYGVETKALKQAVKRNLKRFPSDFMFEMTEIELKNWRSQNVTSNSDKNGAKVFSILFYRTRCCHVIQCA